MYGYEETIELEPEQLLQKVSQEKIFEFALQEVFDFSRRYKSPFREHSKGSGTCRFEQREDGTILFVDFGDLEGRTHRTCFRMVMDMQKCSLQSALKIIAQQFNLSLDKTDYKPIILTSSYKGLSVEANQRTQIDYERKDFTKFDVQFWSQFLIKSNELLEDNVYAASSYTVHSPTKGIKRFPVYKHVYAIDFIDAVKIYQPYNHDYKFITNCNENHIGNIDNLPPTGDVLVIQKSYKDHRVLRNVDPSMNVIWFQNEGCIPDEEILVMLLSRFKLIVVFYDNDEAGTVAAMKLVAVLNNLREGSAIMVHLPNYVTKKKVYKDPAQFISKEGRLDLIEALKHIGLWNMKKSL